MQLTVSSIARAYSDENEAYKFIERIRWANGVVCPHCGIVWKATLMNPKNGNRTTKKGTVSYRRIWKCRECRKEFSVLVGTIFEDSKIPLSKWILAMHEMNAAKNGVSSCELARKLGITQKSAWHLGHRIRFGMAHSPLEAKLKGIVEADETYIGGKGKGKRGRGAANKTPVVSVIERGGKVHSQSVAAVTSKNIGAILRSRIESTATLNTDTFPSYASVGKEFAKHETVDHGKGEYVRGAAYTNTAEGYFSQLKRSLNGTYHHVSPKHLDRYLAEFDHRYSMRKEKDGERTEDMIGRTSGKRMTYKDAVSK